MLPKSPNRQGSSRPTQWPDPEPPTLMVMRAQSLASKACLWRAVIFAQKRHQVFVLTASLSPSPDQRGANDSPRSSLPAAARSFSNVCVSYRSVVVTDACPRRSRTWPNGTPCSASLEAYS